MRGRQPAGPRGIVASSGGVEIAAAVAGWAQRGIDRGVGSTGCGGGGGAPALTVNLHDTTGGYGMSMSTKNTGHIVRTANSHAMLAAQELAAMHALAIQ